MNSGYKLNLEWIPLAYRSTGDTKGKDDKIQVRTDVRQEAEPAKTGVKGIYKRGAKKLNH